MLSVSNNSQEMLVVLSGEADVIVTSKSGKKQVIDTLGVGDVLGELAFLNNAPRSADVVAKSTVEALVLSPESIKKVVKSDSKIAAQVYKNLSSLVARRLTQTTKKTFVI
jgi:CRP/FNR family cyclic AMP-dependent transcriptional regulator